MSMHPLAGIGNTIQDLNRLREILTVLTRHGFGYLIDQLHLEAYLPAKGKISRTCDLKISAPTHVRMIMEELGPTFVKLGQALSMRPDLLPGDYIEELAKLRDQVPPFASPSPEAILSEELGKPISKLFKSFEPMPFAAASIAQVHRAVTLDRRQVVVKIQRPGLKRRVESDLEILRVLSKAWESIQPSGLLRHPAEFVDEFEHLIHEELDFLIEARHMERFARNFRRRPHYCFTRVFWDLSTPRCLTLEYIEGHKLSELPAKMSQAHKRRLAQWLVDAYIDMTLEDRFFQADPHSGNFLLTRNQRLAFLDAGQVGRLDVETMRSFTDMLLALVRQDTEGLVDAYLLLGTPDENVDRRQLRKDVEIFLEPYYTLAIEKISFGRALQDLLALAVRHRIQLPPDFVILGKTFLGVEGLARSLDPGLNLIQAVQPRAEKLFRKRYAPERITRSILGQAKDLWRFLKGLPNQLHDLLGKLQHGLLKIEFEHLGLEELQHSLERASNRLSFSLIVASLIVGSSFILGSQVGPKWAGVSILGLIGFVLAGFFGFLLIIAILRSGRM